MRRVRPFLWVLVLGAVLAAACGDGAVQRSPDGGVREAATISVFDVEVGDCFQDPAAEELVDLVEVVPCDQPHDNEVYAVLQHPAPDGAEFPGEEAMGGFADESCVAEFEGYVGIDYAESIYYFGVISPTPDTWADGDREVVCLLFDISGTRLTGSVRGTAR